MNDEDVVDIDTKFVGSDLREGSLFALPMRRSSGHDGDGAGGLDLDGGAFPTSGGRGGRGADGADLAVGGNTDADEAALGAGCFLLLADLRVIDGLEGLLQGQGVI